MDIVNSRKNTEDYRVRRYQCPVCNERTNSVEIIIGNNQKPLSALVDIVLSHCKSTMLTSELLKRIDQNKGNIT